MIMHKNTKKNLLIAVITALVIAVVVFGIYALSTDAAGNNWFERQATALSVNGDKVSMGEFSAAYTTYVNNIQMKNIYAQMGYGGTYVDTGKENWQLDVKKIIASQLIQERVFAQKAADFGLALTAEEKASIKEAGRKAVEDLRKECLKAAIQRGYAGAEASAILSNSSGSGDPLAELEKRGLINASAKNHAQEMIAEAMIAQGTTLAQFRKNAEKEREYNLLYDKVVNYYLENIYVEDDAALPGVYEEFVQKNFADDYKAGDYSNYIKYYMGGSISFPPLYVPENALFVRYIDAGEGEEGKARAEELLGKLDEGADFEALVASEDNQSEFGREYAEPYALMADDNFLTTEVFESATKLEDGAYALVESESTVEDAGSESGVKIVTHYYLILKTNGTTGMVPYDKVADKIKDTLIRDIQSKEFAALADKWEQEAKVFINDKRINKMMGVKVSDIED